MRVPPRVPMLAALAATTMFVYLVSPAKSAWYWQCPVHAWTGLLCPGCGGTRAVHALLHGELREAMRWNALAIVLFIGAWTALAAQWRLPLVQRIKLGGAIEMRRPRLILYASAAIVTFTLFRNLGF